MADFAAQQHFKLNHTMFRVQDATRSLDFYQNKLGFKLIHRMDSEKGQFTNYFLAFPGASTEQHFLKREGVLELCHNWSHSDDFPGYCNGNTDPGRGFGHICIVCDDIQATCAHFESIGVPFKKRLTDGSMKNIAFILDPDGYWIELISPDFTA